MATENIVIRFRADGTREVTREFDRIDSRAQKTASSVNFLRRALTFVGAAAAIRGVTRTLADFEQTMATVKGVTGATEAEFRQLRDTAAQLGSTTRFTASQAGEALLLLAKAGFTVEESLGAVEGTLRLAQAGGLDLGAAADIASTVLRGFRLEVSETARVVDILATAANASNTDVSELGEAMKFVAPVAAGVGVAIEDATAAIAALSDAGLKGSLAGTGLRRVLSELESPSTKTAKILANLGVTTDEVRVSQVGLEQAIIRLAQAGVTTGQALEIFGDRGGPAFEVLSSNIPKLLDFAQKLRDAGGSASALAEIMDDNLKGALFSASSALEAVVIQLGEIGLTDALETFFRGLADSLRFVAANIERFVDFAIAASLIPALLATIKVIRLLTLAIAANPIGLLLVALSTAIGLLFTFRNDIKVSADGVASLGDFVVAFGQTALSVLEAVFFTTGKFLGVLTEGEAKVGNLGAAFEDMFRLLALGFDSAVGILTGFFAALINVFTRLPAIVGDIIITTVNRVLDALGSLITLAIKGLNKFIDVVNTNVLSAAGLEIDLFNAVGFDRLENKFVGEAGNLGQLVGESFAQGLRNSNSGTAFIDEVFEKAKQRGADRESSASRSTAAGEVFAQVGALQEQFSFETPPLVDAAAAVEDLSNKTIEAQSAFDGFGNSFKQLNLTAADFGATLAESVIGSIDSASAALADFALTGFQDIESLKEAFSNLFADLAKQILQIIIQTLILKSIQAAFGGATVPGVPGGGLPERATGGPVSANRPVLVGERGPEIIMPTGQGNVMPNGSFGKPEVNVQVVNVRDPNEIPAALNTPEAKEVILNIVRTNNRSVR